MGRLKSKQYGFDDENGQELYIETRMVFSADPTADLEKKVILFDQKEQIEYSWPIKDFREMLEEMLSLLEGE